MKRVFLISIVLISYQASGITQGLELFTGKPGLNFARKLDNESKQYGLYNYLYDELDKGQSEYCELDTENKLFNCEKLTKKVTYSTIYFMPDTLLFIGASRGIQFNPDSLVIEIRDTEMNLINSESFAVTNALNSTRLIVKDSFHIYCSSVTANPSIDFQEFVIPKDLNLKKIVHKYHNADGEYVSDLIVNSDSSGYICYMVSGIYSVDNQFKKLNKLDTLLTFKQGSVIDGINGNFIGFGVASNPKAGANSTFGIAKFNSKMELLAGDTIGPFNGIRGAIFKSLDKDETHYFVAGMDDMHIDPYYSTLKNNLFIGKYDQNIKRVWFKKYGGDRRYILFGSYANGDGGCCVHGFVRDSATNYEVIPFIMCFNSDGNITSYQEQHPEQNKAFKLKGNPAKDQFILSNVSQQSNCTYEIIDISGRMVQNGIIEFTENVIGVSTLPPAFYNLVIKDQNGRMLQTEKLIKVE